MKRILITILILAILTSSALGDLTNSVDVDPGQITSYWWTGEPLMDVAWAWSKEVEDILEGTTAIGSIFFDPTDIAPGTDEGRFYYHESDECLKLRTSSAWVDIDISGASSLGTAYNSGYAITVASNPVTLNVAADGACSALFINFDEVDNDTTDAFRIDTEADDSTAVAIQIDGVAGYDIQGTSDTWNVAIDGTATLVGLTVTTEDIELENGGEIQNVVDTEIRFMENSEDFIFDFVTDVITFKSGTDVITADWGDVDDHVGLRNITYDAAEAGTLTLAGTGSDDNLTVQQTTSGQDASLILQSTGTGTDAVSIIASVGGLNVDVADSITVDTTSGAFTLTLGDGTNGDYIMTAADTASSISVDDFHIGSTAGTITIEAEEDATDAVLITADGGTTTTLKIHNDTGTSVNEGASSIQLSSDAGGIGLESNANLAKSIWLIADAGATETILIESQHGTGASAATQEDASVQLYSLLGGIGLMSKLNGDNSIRIEADGGANENIFIQSNQGTGADSITLISDEGGIALTGTAGPIVLTADGATAGDITIDSEDDMTFTVAGDATFAVTGTLTLGEIRYKRNVTVVTASTTTLMAVMSGNMYVTTASQLTHTFTLPTAAAGLTFTFIDVSASAGDDVCITASSGDSINGGTAAKDYINVSDAIPGSVTLTAGDADNWYVTSSIGTWVNEDS